MATESELLDAARRRRDAAVWEANDQYEKDVAAIRTVIEIARRKIPEMDRLVGEHAKGAK